MTSSNENPHILEMERGSDSKLTRNPDKQTEGQTDRKTDGQVGRQYQLFRPIELTLNFDLVAGDSDCGWPFGEDRNSRW